MVTWRQPGSGASVHTWRHQTGAPHFPAVSQLQYLHRLNMRKWFFIRERIDDSEYDQMKLTPPALWNYHKYELVAGLVVTGAWPGAQRHGVWPQNYPNQRSPAVSLYQCIHHLCCINISTISAVSTVSLYHNQSAVSILHTSPGPGP